MGRNSAYNAIERALENAILGDSEAFVLSPLDQISDAKLMSKEVANQLKYLHQLSRSLETNIRFHQGRVLSQTRSDKGTYDERMSTKVYKLLKGAECLIPTFFGKVSDVAKLTDYEIRKLRALFEDPINDDLEDLLNFEVRDELFPMGDQDVSHNSLYP